jgi:hypothetical protein
MRTKIQNIDDLKAEIERLGRVRIDMEAELKMEANIIRAKIKAPFQLFSKLHDFLGFGKDKSQSKEYGDWVSSIFQVGLPVLITKFLFPKSGLIVKSIIEFISQNTAKSMNKDFISNILDKLSNWIKSSGRKSKTETELADYGIPPDSETY